MHDISLFFQTKYILFFIMHDKFLFFKVYILYLLSRDVFD